MMLNMEENLLKLSASGEADDILYICAMESPDGEKIARIFESGIFIGASPSIMTAIEKEFPLYRVHSTADVTMEKEYATGSYTRGKSLYILGNLKILY